MQEFSAAPSSLSEDERLTAYAVRLMYRMSVFGSVVGTLVAVLTGGYFWLWHQAALAPGWVLYFGLILIVRIVVYLSYRKARDVDENPGVWITVATLTMLASGIGWGAAAFLFFDLNQLLTISVVLAMGISGILLLAPDNKAMAAFNGPLFAALLYQLAMTQDIAAWIAAAIIAILAGTLVLHARHMQEGIRDSLRLAFDNENLVRTLSASKDELETLNDKLRKEVETRAAVESQVKAAQISAESANMAKDEFLATMSHEIRTPLNGILPILDILVGTRLDESQREYLNTAYTSSKHLLTIIDDILDYSKIEAGKLELESVGINLRELLDAIVRLMASAAKKKGLELKAAIEPDVRLAMRGDPVRLRQVLTNLIGNAIKFTETGSVTVTVSKRQVFPTETELLFTVKDTGVGMDKATSERLFQPFSQADASTTRTHGGTGLGLVICKRLVDLMGGKIGVKSKPNRGSVFWFTARLKKAMGDMDGPQREVSGSRALLVSPDEELARRLGVFSEQIGLRLESCNRLQDAAGRTNKAAKLGGTWTFDTLILDLPALGVDAAVKFAGELRKEQALSDMGLLVLTDDGEVPAQLKSVGQIAARMRTLSQGALKDTVEVLLAGGDEGTASVVTDRELAYAASEAVGDGKIGGHVLLVEDNPVNGNVAQKLLEVIGITFEWAKNGKEAVDLLNADPGRYQAVLMDCMMPIMDGYTATAEWRKIEHARNLTHKPIMAMTANAMAGDREKCLNAGMDDYMSKPLNRGLLHQMLAKWLPEDAPGRRAIQSKPRPEPSTSEITSATASAMPRTQKPDPHGVIDRQVVSDLIDLMGSDFQDLVTVFLDDSPKLIRQMAKAVEGGTVQQLVGPAHSLKSTAANLGATVLAELCKSIEHDARRGSVPKASERISRVVMVYKKVAAALKQIRDES